MKWYIQVDDHATGTDHGDKEWEEAIDRQQEPYHESAVGRDIAAMTMEDADAATKLLAELVKERAQLHAE
jgi:histidinol-phosphate/aromatic aminotransferase/cobyric acid decarboxylase-like protein